jgi:hypothetical protein
VEIFDEFGELDEELLGFARFHSLRLHADEEGAFAAVGVCVLGVV